MYAVIESGGKQHRVELGSEIQVDRLDAQPGDSITLERVLLVADGDSAAVGQPVVDGASVSAKVLAQGRGRKIVVFKYKPKARTRVKNGFRAELTTLRITDIAFAGKSAAEEAEKAKQAKAREAEKAHKAEMAAARKAADEQAAADKALASKLAEAEAEPKPKASASRKRSTTSQVQAGEAEPEAQASETEPEAQASPTTESTAGVAAAPAEEAPETAPPAADEGPVTDDSKKDE